jgi:hypothetical protein
VFSLIDNMDQLKRYYGSVTGSSTHGKHAAVQIRTRPCSRMEKVRNYQYSQARLDLGWLEKAS